MINNYNEIKKFLNKYFFNIFTLSAHSTDSNKVNISYLSLSSAINFPISEIELVNALFSLLLNGDKKELSNETN